MNPRLAELLKAQPAGQPMGDELVELLAEHLVVAAGSAHPMDAALCMVLEQTIRLVETLHKIRKP